MSLLKCLFLLDTVQGSDFGRPFFLVVLRFSSSTLFCSSSIFSRHPFTSSPFTGRHQSHFIGHLTLCMAHIRIAQPLLERCSLSAARTIHTSRCTPRADTLSRTWQRKMEAKERYRDWTKESLLSRIAELEAQTTLLRATQARIDTEAHVARTAASEPEPTKGGSAAGGKTESPNSQGHRSNPNSLTLPLRHVERSRCGLRTTERGYSGLAAQNAVGGSGSTLPTVEGVLWDAMCTARLVDPALGMDGAGFSRCGRTDRGVSAAGQVVALWVRSKRLNQWDERMQQMQEYASSPISKPSDEEWAALQGRRNAKLESDELPYVSILNRILPPTIRIQAWSPVRSGFSSRFDCVYRHYKYFFLAGPPRSFFPPTTSGADAAAVGSQDAAATRLDIEAMRDAARRLLGEHDFRNLCKVDASKQITNYRRRIDGVSIDRVTSHWPCTSRPIPDGVAEADGEEHMYVLNLRGTAFLYHQVRNIMAILFLVGARLEHASVVEELMNTESGQIAADRVQMRLAAQQHGGQRGVQWWLPVNATSPSTSSVPEGLPMWIHSALSTSPSDFATSDADLEVYTTKPNYEMAADRPLVLWECGFLPTDVEWRVGTYDGALSAITARQELENQTTASHALLRIHKMWTQHSISTQLWRHFVLASPSTSTATLPSRTEFDHASYPCLAKSEVEDRVEDKEGDKSNVIPLGNGTARGAANYVPLKQRQREEPYEVKNRRWAEGTGKRRAERRLEQKRGDEVEGEG